MQSADVLWNSVAFYRKQAGLTQEQLGAMIGSTRDYVAKLEGKKKALSPDYLERLGSALGVPPYMLIAPPDLIPTEEELAQLLADAQAKMPVDLPYSEWPRSLAGELRTRLRKLADDRASAGA